VDDAAVVGVRDGVADLDEDVEPALERRARVERLPLFEAFLRLGDQRVEISTFDELHRVGEGSVGALLDPVDRHDVGVIELRGDLHLAEEAGEQGRLPLHRRKQRFERDLAAQDDVASEVHHAHGAFAERLQRLEVAGVSR
jgi:hypothetical protein